MPGTFGLKSNLPRKKIKSRLPRAVKRPEQKPPWNDTVTDLSVHRSTPEEVRRRRTVHQSKNAETAKMELLEKRVTHAKTLDANGNKSDELTEEKTVLQTSYEDKENSFLTPMKYPGIPSITMAPTSRLQCDLLNAGGKNADAQVMKSEQNSCFPWAGLKTPKKNSNDNGDIIQAINDTEKVKKIKSTFLSAGDALISPTEQHKTLLALYKQLSLNVKMDETQEDKISEHNSTDSSEDGESTSTFSSILLDTLKKVSQQYSELADRMEAERKEREKLKSEVEGLKKIVNNLTAEVVYLRSEMQKRDLNNKDNKPIDRPNSQSNHDLNIQPELPTSSPSMSLSADAFEIGSNSAHSDYSTITLTDKQSTNKHDSELNDVSLKKDKPLQTKTHSDGSQDLQSTSRTTLSNDLYMSSEITSDVRMCWNQTSRNDDATSDYRFISESFVFNFNSTINDCQTTLSPTLPVTLPPAVMLSPPLQLDMSCLNHQNKDCKKDTCCFCLDPQLSVLKVLDMPQKDSLLYDSFSTVPSLDGSLVSSLSGFTSDV